MLEFPVFLLDIFTIVLDSCSSACHVFGFKHIFFSYIFLSLQWRCHYIITILRVWVWVEWGCKCGVSGCVLFIPHPQDWYKSISLPINWILFKRLIVEAMCNCFREDDCEIRAKIELKFKPSSVETSCLILR